MVLNTKMLRNFGLMTLLAALSLPQARAAEFQDCGPYYCASMCPSLGKGGYILAIGCSSCDGQGCAGGGENCQEWCFVCAGEGEWSCY
jgi:hypothetical protein